jgi:hypothetical protein
MRFGERRYLICMPEALVVAQYLGFCISFYLRSRIYKKGGSNVVRDKTVHNR